MTARYYEEIKRRLLAGVLVMAAFCGLSKSAPAEDWMFRRSYYSHELPEGQPVNYPLPVSRSAYRVAHYREGFGISTGFRVNNYVIQNGNRVDRTFYREGWVEFMNSGE